MRISSLQPGDRVLFNDRSIPCIVQSAKEVNEYVGSIAVLERAILEGPKGADIWLERTHTNRKRVKESAPWGAYANVRRLEKL